MPDSGTISQVSVPPPSPQPRRIATPSWFDLRLVLGVLLVLVSVLIGAKVVDGARSTTATVVATRDLAAGTVLTAGDVRLAQAQLPGHGKGVYLTATTGAVGRRLTRAVSRGELVPAAAVARVRTQTTLTVPLASGTAPDLRAGQRIELWVSSATCPSTVLLPDVTVQAVHPGDDGSFSDGTGGQNVVISVEPAQAGRVIAALALDEVKLRAGILVGPAAGDPDRSAPPDQAATPSGTPAPSGAASSSGSPAAGDLAACAAASPTK
jgi:SAF domain-containing protein